MSASATRERRSGFSLLEVIIAVTIFAVVLALFFGMWSESITAGNSATVKAELRAKGQDVLNRIVNDLRSTQSGSGAVSLDPVDASLPSNLKALSFYPIYGYTTSTATGSAALFWTTSRTIYQWDPSGTTNPTPGSANWNLSTIQLTTYDLATLKQAPRFTLLGEVSDFTVTPLGTTALSGFTSGSAQTFRISITLCRKHVFGKQGSASNNFDGLSVTLTTNVTVPPG